MDDVSNEERADWAFSALRSFRRSCNGSPLDNDDGVHEAICDLIANLGHLATERNIDFNRVIQSAVSVWTDEEGEDRHSTPGVEPKSADRIQWSPIGDAYSDTDPTCALKAKRCTLAGVNMHLLAIAVLESDDTETLQEPVDGVDEIYRDLCSFSGGSDGPLETTEIDGRKYVIWAVPHTA
jgi:hypothetical protein